MYNNLEEAGSSIYDNLDEGEAHPATKQASLYLRHYKESHPETWEIFKEAITEGEGRLMEVLADSIVRYEEGDFISDRAVLGLAFSLMYSSNAMHNNAVRDALEAKEELRG